MTVPISDPNPPGYVDESHLRSGNFGKPYILNRVFDLLVLMIDVLQRTAAAQANRLNFLTQWQKAYTDELNQIHAFVAGNGDQMGSSANWDPATANKLPDRSGVRNFVGTITIEDETGDRTRPNAQTVLYSGGHIRDSAATEVSEAEYPIDGLAYGWVNTEASPSKGAISSNTTDANAARQDLTTQNATYTQQIQGNLNVISNDAKSLQASVNQSNDAVQAQADMATSILQQLSTILTAIFQ
jgi:hypothetical protein